MDSTTDTLTFNVDIRESFHRVTITLGTTLLINVSGNSKNFSETLVKAAPLSTKQLKQRAGTYSWSKIYGVDTYKYYLTLEQNGKLTLGYVENGQTTKYSGTVNNSVLNSNATTFLFNVTAEGQTQPVEVAFFSDTQLWLDAFSVILTRE